MVFYYTSLHAIILLAKVADMRKWSGLEVLLPVTGTLETWGLKHLYATGTVHVFCNSFDNVAKGAITKIF